MPWSDWLIAAVVAVLIAVTVSAVRDRDGS